MLVVLRENVENLGIVGDVVRVTGGYARNFLLPRKLAVPADENNVKQLEHQKKILEKKRLAQKSAAEELAKKLSDVSLTFTRKVGENEKLFGSVTAAEIHEELKKAGFEVEKRQVLLDEPLKDVGVHEVPVKLLPAVTAKVKVWVAKEQE